MEIPILAPPSTVILDIFATGYFLEITDFRQFSHFRELKDFLFFLTVSRQIFASMSFSRIADDRENSEHFQVYRIEFMTPQSIFYSFPDHVTHFRIHHVHFQQMPGYLIWCLLNRNLIALAQLYINALLILPYYITGHILLEAITRHVTN